MQQPGKRKMWILKIQLQELTYTAVSTLLSWPVRSASRSAVVRRLFGRALPSGTLVCVDTGDASFVVNSSDRVIALETFAQRKAYDYSKVRLVADLLPSGHTRELLVDVGANIGTICVSAVADGHFRRAVAFEPEINNFRLLKANVVLNGLESAIEVHNLAMSDSPNEALQFELCGDNHGDHRVRVESESVGHHNELSRRVTSVKAQTLDAFADGFEPLTTLIWMDTQGFEGPILAGAKEVIRRRVPLCLEFWPYGLRRAKTFDTLLQALADSSYATIIDLDDNPVRPRQFDVGVLHSIAERLGDRGDFTDLLLL